MFRVQSNSELRPDCYVLASQGILGIFQKLISGKAHDHEGFKLLTSLAEHVPNETFSNYLSEVCASMNECT